MSSILAWSLGQSVFFLFCLLEKLNPARDCTSIPHKTKGDLFQPESNVFISTSEENLRLVKAEEFWHLPASAFVSFLISDALLELVNSCIHCYIIIFYSVMCASCWIQVFAVILYFFFSPWACGIVCGWNWEGKQLILDWVLILDILLPSDKQYEWDIFKEHKSV